VRILLTGANGLLARAIRAQPESWAKLIPRSHSQLDITDREAIASELRQVRPDVVINCAAYSLVDAAESNAGHAYAVNCTGPLWLAEACTTRNIRLVQISTDYVFDGTKQSPYTEDDAVAPLNVYGRTKLASEMALRDVSPATLIVRTQWLFGAGGGNFVSSIVDRARLGEPLRVVNDQVGAPTYAFDLAAAILELIQRECIGLVHVSNGGYASWYDVACAAISAAGLSVNIAPCSTSDVQRPARRPAYGVLDNARYIALTQRPLRDWREAIQDFLSPAVATAS
jgi:dTDP-4-dehydrorhamnose reductase